MQLRTIARLFLGVTMIGIGVIGVAGGGFAPIWRPVSEAFPARELLADLCSVVSLATGAGLLAKRTAAPAALVLFAYLLVWTILFKGPFVVRAPLVEGTYQSLGENAVLIAAAWLLAGWNPGNQTTWKFGMLTGPVAQRLAFVLYGLALLAFGLSHFVYVDLTTPLVPKWLPEPVFWAYLTGVIYLLSGAAILSVVATRAGAALAAIQITLITLLVWGPMVAAGQLSAMHWQETVVSWALTAGAWVLASGSPQATGRLPQLSPSRRSASSDMPR